MITEDTEYAEQLAAERGDPYIEHLNGNVTITPTTGPTLQGYLWRLTPEVARVITDDDAMVEIRRDDITNLAPMRYGLGDRIAVTSYDGRFEAEIVNVLPGLLSLRLDDGRVGKVSLPPPEGATITSLRSATQEERDAALADLGITLT